MAKPTQLFGLMAEFIRPEELLEAADKTAGEGYAEVDAYTPFPVEGLAKAIRRSRSWLPLVFLIGGLTGGGGGYFMEWFSMARAYPLNVGGRPLHSWPSFIPVTFELTILTAAISGVIALFFAMRLPRLHHPVFGVPGFERATVDRFFLCVKSSDPLFSVEATRRFLETLQPVRIVEVPQ